MSSKLEQSELWVLDIYFRQYGLHSAHDVGDIRHRLILLSFGETDAVLASLVSKKVLSVSPDQTKVRLTDYGAELYVASKAAEGDWEKRPIIRVSTLDRDEVVIRAGEMFRANRLLRDILSQAQKDLCLVDPYVGSVVFDLCEDAANGIPLRILTSTKAQASAVAAYRAFKAKYPSTEMRTADPSTLHDRYILWDRSQGVHLGHSIKDLGTRDTRVSKLQTPTQQFKLFEERWAKAASVA